MTQELEIWEKADVLSVMKKDTSREIVQNSEEVEDPDLDPEIKEEKRELEATHHQDQEAESKERDLNQEVKEEEAHPAEAAVQWETLRETEVKLEVSRMALKQTEMLPLNLMNDECSELS